MEFQDNILTLRLVDSNDRAAILLYNVLEKSNTVPIPSNGLPNQLVAKQFAVDKKTVFNQVKTMKGFVRGGYSYFIGSKSRKSNENSTEINPSTVTLTRICNIDKTEQIDSRMDLHINFIRAGVVAGVRAAYYDPKRDQVWIIVYSVDGEQTMCRFEMKPSDERDKNTLIAVALLGFPDNIYIMTDIVPDLIYNNTFISSQHKNYAVVEWICVHTTTFQLIGYTIIIWHYDRDNNFSFHIPFHHLSTISSVQYLPGRKLFPTMRHNIALSGNSLFMINRKSVTSQYISCDGFYKTCEYIVQTGKTAPIQCVWCADEDYQMAVSISDPIQSCLNTITEKCPANAERNTTAALLRRRKFVSISTTTTTTIKTPVKVVEKEVNWTTVAILVGIAIVILLLIGLLMIDYRKRTHIPTSKIFDVSNNIPLQAKNTYVADNIDWNSFMYYKTPQVKYDYGKIFNDIDDHIKIDISRLLIAEKIGEGNFGIVLRATYSTSDDTRTEVACKMLRAGEPGIRAFLHEGLTMVQFHHARVLPFIGIAIANNTDPIIVTKYMPNGNLLNYRQDTAHTVTWNEMRDFALQIAEGMEYLHSKMFIHRDLAARNCMLDIGMQLKIGDFGLARQCNNENMYNSYKYPEIAFDWAPIEALESLTFTLKGDVWSYGVVLWELTSRGDRPCIKYNHCGLLKFLKQGKRLKRPESCPEKFYSTVMLPCWEEDMNTRPSFEEILKLLSDYNEDSDISRSRNQSEICTDL